MTAGARRPRVRSSRTWSLRRHLTKIRAAKRKIRTTTTKTTKTTKIRTTTKTTKIRTKTTKTKTTKIRTKTPTKIRTKTPTKTTTKTTKIRTKTTTSERLSRVQPLAIAIACPTFTAQLGPFGLRIS